MNKQVPVWLLIVCLLLSLFTTYVTWKVMFSSVKPNVYIISTTEAKDGQVFLEYVVDGVLYSARLKDKSSFHRFLDYLGNL